MKQRSQIRHIINLSLIAFLLIIFAATKVVSSIHGFSHQISETKILQKNVSFFEKIFHGEKNSNKNSHDCLICVASDFQNKILLPVSSVFVATILYFIFSTRKFSRVKLSFLLSSNFSRAPPAVS